MGTAPLAVRLKKAVGISSTEIWGDMDNNDIHCIRNIGIIAHIDAGKPTTTEGILFYSGLTHRYGNIDDGTTVMDFLPEERARGITIVAAAATIPWRDHLIHLIDTPGHIDFTAEVERSLRVIDGAVIIFSGVEGVEAQSEKVWRQADKNSVPKIAFVNKLDRIGAAFSRVVGEINEKFGDCAVPLQQPVGIEDKFDRIVDLVTFECLSFAGEHKEQVRREPIPRDLQDEMMLAREAMIERLADECDEIAMLYLEGEDIKPNLIRQTVRRLTLARRIVPIFLGSGKMNTGIQPLMDAVINYLPSPADCDEIPAYSVRSQKSVLLHPDPKAPFAGFIFKVSASPTADLYFCRTYSGTLRSGATLVNSRTGQKVRPKQVFKIHAKSTETLQEVGPGDIVGLVGLRDCGIGDTLCEPRQVVAFEKIAFPEPVVSMAVEPRSSKDKGKLEETLALLCREDQTLSQTQDDDTGQRLLSGMGELHLEISLKRLTQDFNVEVRVGEPRVAYRETLRKEAMETVEFSRMIGETEVYAGMDVAFKPLPHGEEMFTITNAMRGAGAIPRQFVIAAEKALSDGLRTGGNHGYALIYLAAELTKLRIRPDRTTDGAVVAAALQAIDQAISHVGTKVLEPLMHLEILTPEETVGDITMYLQPRRAIIHDMTAVGRLKRISCKVPLAEMFGFGRALPRLTGGRGSFSMEPCGYQDIPKDVAERMFGAF